MIIGADLPLTSIHGVLHRRPSLLRSTVVFSFFVSGSGSDRCASGSDRCASGSGWQNSHFHIPVWGCIFLREKWKWTFAVFGRLHKFRVIFIILVFGNVPDILLQHYSRS